MTLQEAIQKRINDLCTERRITLNDLSISYGIPQSTLDDALLNKDTEIATIEEICIDLGISLADFFCCDTFRNIETG